MCSTISIKSFAVIL